MKIAVITGLFAKGDMNIDTRQRFTIYFLTPGKRLFENFNLDLKHNETSVSKIFEHFFNALLVNDVYIKY